MSSLKARFRPVGPTKFGAFAATCSGLTNCSFMIELDLGLTPEVCASAEVG